MLLNLLAVSIALILLGLAVFVRQAQATSCRRHSRLAGRMAVAIGSAAVVVGIGLIAYALIALG